MSIHSDCGAEIRWPRKSDEPEAYGPPLEYAGQGYVFDENSVAIQVSVYKSHVCRADQMAEWLDNKIKVQRLLATKASKLPVTNEDYRQARQQLTERNHDMALSVGCPLCGAVAGEPCIHIVSGRAN